MNAQTAIKPFDSYKAYQREREYSRKLEDLLSRSLMILGMECDRREMNGEDCSGIRDFIRRART